MRNKDRATE